METFPNLAKETMRMTISFSTTYFYESGFSTMICIKNNHSNRLQLEDDLWVALSKTEPSFKKLVMIKQQQKSH